LRVEITDVFLRDGLQDEPVVVPTAGKLRVAAALADAGLPRLEAGSFVSPAKVPQMADAAELLAAQPAAGTGPRWTVLALNARGIARAAEAGAREIQIVASASPEHSAANAGRSTWDALADLAAEVERHPGIAFFAGVSTAFTCSFSGDIDPGHLLRVVRAFTDMGVRRIGLADTIGTTPTARLMSSLGHVRAAEPSLDYSLHLHNAHGQALETVDAALAEGIVRYDAALAGFGGCPFAPGAAGNLATEELVRHLHIAGHETGIDEALLSRAAALAQAAVQSAPAIDVPPSLRRSTRTA
jgi:hydroxymethylglutaryl-CoA lyase